MRHNLKVTSRCNLKKKKKKAKVRCKITTSFKMRNKKLTWALGTLFGWFFLKQLFSLSSNCSIVKCSVHTFFFFQMQKHTIIWTFSTNPRSKLTLLYHQTKCQKRMGQKTEEKGKGNGSMALWNLNCKSHLKLRLFFNYLFKVWTLKRWNGSLVII